MARYAVIDIGTNSIKLHIAECLASGEWREILDTNNISRLGEGMQRSGMLSAEAMTRNQCVLAELLATAHTHHVEHIVGVGTMCLRSAANAQDFIRDVERTCGLSIEVLSGQEEARLAYLAAQTGLQLTTAPVVVFDTGGGSTEFIIGNGTRIQRRFSLNVGAVRYTEEFLCSDPVTTAEFLQAVTCIERDLSEMCLPKGIRRLIGIGGTVTNLGAVKHQLVQYDSCIVHGALLARTDIEAQIERYRCSSLVERQTIPGLDSKRADVILAGAIIVRTILAGAEVNEVTVSDRGLRHAILRDRFGNC